MIKNIVFDMGNVILRFDPDYFLDRLNIKSSKDRELLKNKVFRSVEWVMLDRGTLVEAEAEKKIMQRLPTRLHEAAHKLIFEWDEPLLPVEGMTELVKALKKNGYSIYLLSNASVRQPDYWKRAEASKYFDGTLISASVHQIKPNPEIYHLFFEKFNLKPEECVFIDDVPGNIEGAIRAGMNGIVFNGIQDLKDGFLKIDVRLS